MSKDPRAIKRSQADPDSAVVFDYLRGAMQSPRDPDLELATLLPGLEEKEGHEAVITVLRRLVSDENPD